MALDLATVKAERDRLKKCSQRLDAERAEMAALLAEVQAERDRLDAEGAEALKSETIIREAEARAAVGEVMGICSWDAHKRTATDPEDVLKTGRGWIVVRPLEPSAVAKALSPSGSFSDQGLGVYDVSAEAVERALLKAVVVGPDIPLRAAPGDEPMREAMIKRFCCETPAVAARAYRACLQMAGLWAVEVRGK